MPSRQTPFYPDMYSEGYIAGWGLTRDDDYESVPNQLQNAKIDILNPNLCLLETAESKICAGRPDFGIGACNGNFLWFKKIRNKLIFKVFINAGDSGGPLYVKEDGKQIVAGITSYGLGSCGGEKYPEYKNHLYL